jgi:hypothetical protein
LVSSIFFCSVQADLSDLFFSFFAALIRSLITAISPFLTSAFRCSWVIALVARASSRSASAPSRRAAASSSSIGPVSRDGTRR